MTDEHTLDDETRALYIARGVPVYVIPALFGAYWYRRVSDDSLLTPAEVEDYEHHRNLHSIRILSKLTNYDGDIPTKITPEFIRQASAEIEAKHPFIWNDPREVKP